MPVIKIWLETAAKQLLSVNIPSSRLDSELIISEVLQKNRTYIHSHPEQIIYSKQLKRANLYLEQRLKRIPLAYILGYKEFYGRKFKVTPDVLIPRPETEAFIDILHEILLPTTYYLLPTFSLIDVGTGSGCLGITAKLEFPSIDVTLADISNKALNIAKCNAKALKADVNTLKSDLLAKYNNSPDIIVANLPYVDKSWECSPETNFEPKLALFADNSGKELIYKLIIQASEKLSKNGYLIIEADPRQHKSIIGYAKNKSLKQTHNNDYIITFIKD